LWNVDGLQNGQQLGDPPHCYGSTTIFGDIDPCPTSQKGDKTFECEANYGLFIKKKKPPD